MPSELRRIDDPHEAPIAPDIIPADWADCVPHPANDATSREKLFAEIRHAAETAAPEVDTSFRASDVSDNPTLKGRARSRAWIKRALGVFAFALISALAAAAWERHGDTAKQTLANWVPLPAESSSPAIEPVSEPAGQPVDPQATAAQAPAETTSGATALPPEVEQQIQTMARDLAAMGHEIEQLKAAIETLKTNRQAAIAPAAPIARSPAPPPKPKAMAPSARSAPAPQVPAPAQPAAAAQSAATAVPAYPPPQATTQPNGEPIVRPPMPLPLSDRY